MWNNSHAIMGEKFMLRESGVNRSIVMNYLLTAVVLQPVWKLPAGNFMSFKTTVCDFTKPYCSYFLLIKNQILQQFVFS
jgi:hypothetical protein